MPFEGRIDHEAIEASVKLDVKDKRILTLLSEDARAPLTRIAKKVRLSRDAVDYRIKRLEDKGVILRFFPNLNYGKLGYFIFHVFLLVDELDKDKQVELLKFLKTHPNVISVMEYSDRWDFETVLLAKNLLEFDKIMMDIAGKFPQIILEKDKVELIRRYNARFLPPLLPETTHGIEPIKRELMPAAHLDETDVKILQVLGDDCRLSTYKVGEKIGISADAVSYRIKNMVKEGVIRNFTILVNFSLLKYYWYTYTVEMKMFDKKAEDKFKAFLEHNKNILRSAKTLGGWDLLLYIVVENPREFHKTVKSLKNVFSAIVRNYQTWIAFKEHVFDPVPDCVDGR